MYKTVKSAQHYLAGDCGGDQNLMYRVYNAYVTNQDREGAVA